MPRRSRRFVLALAAGLGLLVESDPGATAPADVTPYRADVDIVTVDVWVADRRGLFVSGLKRDDFLILDGGTPRMPSVFIADDALPLASVLLIDRSGSMAGVPLDQARLAAGAFLSNQTTKDLVEVLAFNERVDRVSPFGAESRASLQALNKLEAGGQTALFDALLVARQDLDRIGRQSPRQPRQAIVLLSDGEDTRSVLAFEDVRDELRRSGILVYVLSIRVDDRGRPLPPRWQAEQLAFDTGGRAVTASSPQALASLYDDVHRELRRLYRLGFEPAPLAADGRWHPISVRVRRPETYVRARAGYFAPLARHKTGSRPRGKSE